MVLPWGVDQALDPSQYIDLPALAFKPAGINTLRVCCGPILSRKTPNSTIAYHSRIPDRDGQHMTADVQAALASEGLSPYQGLILASIIEQEVSKPTDKPQVAQVFLSRLKAGPL